MSDFSALEAQAKRVRGHAIRMATNGGCFLGASLSCADLLVYLYDRVLRVSPDRLADPTRDYLLLSKGHDVPALYGTLAERGYFSTARLANHLAIDDHLYWHPNRAVPGVEFHSGSLGHAPAIAVGLALAKRSADEAGRVVVLAGDGELNEGSVWEALLVAAAHRLDNLWLIVDRNRIQANLRTEALVPLEPLSGKLAAFGCETHTVNGHDFAAMRALFRHLAPAGRPLAIVANTVRGKGLPSHEDRADRWFVRASRAETEDWLREADAEYGREREAAMAGDAIGAVAAGPGIAVAS